MTRAASPHRPVSARSHRLGLWVVACAMGAATARLSAAPIDGLRVVDIQPSVFDYLLTGLSRNADGAPRLSFNDRAGSTWFRRPGEHLGPYRVESFEIRTNHAFNGAVNAVLESRVVSVVLGTPSGTNLTLVQGERLPWPGWTARLVSLDTGAGWAVREADAIALADTTARVATVTATSVTICAAGPVAAAPPERTRVPSLSDPERTALAQRWAENARRRQATLAAAVQAQKDEAEASPFQPVIEPAPPPRQITGVRGQPSQMGIGTVYSYPTEFTIVPALWDTSGHLVSERVVIPRHFETRYSGVSLSTRP